MKRRFGFKRWAYATLLGLAIIGAGSILGYTVAFIEDQMRATYCDEAKLRVEAFMFCTTTRGLFCMTTTEDLIEARKASMYVKESCQ